MTFGSNGRQDSICRLIYFVFWAVFICTAVMIFYFSSQVAPKSMQTSNTVGEAINIEITQPQLPVSAQPLLFGLNLRKYAHIILFGVLGFSGFLACGIFIKKIVVKIHVSLIACLIYAVSDELHQTFVSGRNGRIEDVFIDLAGIAVGIFFGLIVDKVVRTLF